MKKNRIFAIFTALCCAAGVFSAFPAAVGGASIWDGGYYIVRDGRGTPDSLGIRHLPGGSDYSIGCSADLAAILEGQEDPQYGDLLYIEFSGEVAEIYPGCMHLNSTDTVTNLGAAESMELTVTANADYTLTLEDAESTTYTYSYGFDEMVLERFFDFENMASGTVIEFAMYEEQPVLPLEVISEETILPVHEFAVMCMNEEKDYYTLCDLSNGMPYSFSLSTFQDYGGVGEPKLGDILRMTGYICCTDLWGVNSFFLTTEDTVEVAAGHARIIGNLIDNENLVKKTKTVSSMDEAGFVSFGNGTLYYNGYDLQNTIDWTTVQSGDQVTMYYYGNTPVFAIADPETIPEPPTRNFVVIGVDDPENPQKYAVRLAEPKTGEPEFFYLDLSKWGCLFEEGSATPAYGDILTIQGYYQRNDVASTQSFVFLTDTLEYTGTPEEVDATIAVTGSIFDAPVTEELTMQSRGGIWTYIYNFTSDTLGTNGYYTDFISWGELTQPDGIDWETVKSGDKVTFYTYEGIPMLPTAVSYLGDANFDNTVTIADVIFLNRQILGDTETARSTFNQTLADYDGNGIIDASDSLMILKRIVELI